MSKRRRGRDVPDRLEPNFAEFVPETYFFDFSDSRAKSRARKSAQLCSQAARLISSSLECDVADEVVQSLVLQEVQHEPGSARLSVTFIAPEGCDLTDVNGRLERVVGVFRDALARGLSRKRVPQLSLTAIPALPHERGWDDE
ncbi:MAG: hypothetical protein AAFV32_10680 [Myxococcota bacterium]